MYELILYSPSYLYLKTYSYCTGQLSSYPDWVVILDARGEFRSPRTIEDNQIPIKGHQKI